MGLGALLTRDLQYDVTDTDTGASSTFTIVTGAGAHPEWSAGPYGGGMSIPSAWRASLLIVDAIASLPWHAYRTRGGIGERLDPTPAVLARPNPHETRIATMTAWALDLLWHGNAVGLITARNRAGWPTAIRPVRAEMAMVREILPGDDLPGQPGEPVYLIDDGLRGSRWYAAHDVFHVKGPCRPGELRGFGVMEAHLRGTLGLAKELNRQAANVAHAAVPSILIKTLNPDADAAEAEGLKTSWMTAQATRRPMVIGPTVDATPLAWNPEETQLVEARRLSDVQVAQVFGIDPSWVGAATSSRQYSNIEQDGIVLVRRTLGGHLARFEEAWTGILPPVGVSVRANRDAELQADTLSRYRAHEIGIRSGFLTDDEARQLEQRPPLTPDQRAAIAARHPQPATPPNAEPATDTDPKD